MKVLNLLAVWLCLWTLAFLCCEWLLDYAILYSCHWPVLNADKSGIDPLHTMILADTHLLGPHRGHWLDKLYREWHMHRAFQVAISKFHPELVFVLGDLFDEGHIVDHKAFDDYVERFYRLFRVPTDTIIISAAGNHDIGFHYKFHPSYIERFNRTFNNTGVDLYTSKGVHFIVINSMAMTGDGCIFCHSAEQQLKRIASNLACLRSPSCKKEPIHQALHNYSHPILMQHFPTYRASDDDCVVHDSPIVEKYREGWDTLSKEATDLLGQLLHPRLAFAGHTHHYCKQNSNRLGIEEYTVASFSWRNKVNPSFMLAKFTSTKHGILKCDMPEQGTTYLIYIVTFCACISITALRFYKYYCKSKKVQQKIAVE